MQPQFAISVHDIDAGGIEKSFDLPLAWLTTALGDTDVSATGPGHASVRLSKTGHDVIVRGKASAPLVMACARCLADVPLPVEAELSLLLRPAKGEHAPHTHGAHGHAHGSSSSHGAHASHSHASHAPAHAASGDAPAAKAKDAKTAKDASKNGAPKKRSHDDEDEYEYEFSADEADSDTYDGELVVLDGFLREALLLEAPSFPLCSEDCPGIRPTAKASSDRGEPAVDPRLSPLRALKTKLMLAAGDKDAATPGDRGQSSSDAGAENERPAAPAKAARPKIQAHRTQSPAGAKGAQAKTRAKHSPKKRAK